MKKIIIALTLILSLSSLSLLATFTGRVVRVIDGETIVVLNDSKEQLTIRLEGIDCPEKGQDFGIQAKNATSDLCFGKEVKIVSHGVDKYGRILAFVYVEDLDICINEELLSLGLAWHYKKYNQEEKLAQLEWIARNNKIGLWSMKNPIAPWDFRHLN